MRNAALLVMATALLLAAPAQALVLSDPVRLVVTGKMSAPAGEDLVLRAPVIILDHATLRGGDGVAATQTTGLGQVRGGPGGPGGSIRLDGAVVCIASTLLPGDGGRGGDARAAGAPHADARGGAGGDAGRVLGDMPGCLVQAARGGRGGEAQAQGASCDGAAGTDGTDDRSEDLPAIGPPPAAYAEGTAGGEGSACAPTAGDGGQGGNATAVGGPGGVSPDGEGGPGGEAVAIAGTGGRGGSICASDVASFDAAYSTGLRVAGTGGFGGHAEATGGSGGNGLIGGPGGLAQAATKGGEGGRGTRLAGGDEPREVSPGAGGSTKGASATGGAGGLGIDGGAGGGAGATETPGDPGAFCELTEEGTAVPQTTASASSTSTKAKDSPGGGALLTLGVVGLALVLRRRA